MEWVLTIVVSMIGSGALSALVAGILSRRKTRAEAHKVNADAATVIVDGASDVIMLLRTQLAEERGARELLGGKVAVLEQSMGTAMRKIYFYEQEIEDLVTLVEFLISRLESAGIEFGDVDLSVLNRIAWRKQKIA